MATSLAGLSGTLRTGSLRISLSGASRRKRSLLRHDRACRRLKLNRTIPVDSSPHARGPSRTPSSRRAAPEPSRQESTGVELRAGPPQSRLGPAPEPLPSRASLRTGKLDSCRFLSTPVDSSPHAHGPSRTRPRSNPRTASRGRGSGRWPCGAKKNIFTASNARFRARRTSP